VLHPQTRQQMRGEGGRGGRTCRVGSSQQRRGQEAGARKGRRSGSCRAKEAAQCLSAQPPEEPMQGVRGRETRRASERGNQREREDSYSIAKHLVPSSHRASGKSIEQRNRSMFIFSHPFLPRSPLPLLPLVTSLPEPGQVRKRFCDYSDTEILSFWDLHLQK
jgi:hypothetical protein